MHTNQLLLPALLLRGLAQNTVAGKTVVDVQCEKHINASLSCAVPLNLEARGNFLQNENNQPLEYTSQGRGGLLSIGHL